jgi:hypothetical protein
VLDKKNNVRTETHAVADLALTARTEVAVVEVYEEVRDTTETQRVTKRETCLPPRK